MKHLLSLKSLAAVTLAFGAFAAASSAQARSDVVFSVGLQLPGVVVQPAPVYVSPRPTAYYLPAPQENWRHDEGRRHHEWQRWPGQDAYRGHETRGVVYLDDSRRGWPPARLHGPYGDMDRDGIVNLHDRDRDGDGVQNRFDRFPDRAYRR